MASKNRTEMESQFDLIIPFSHIPHVVDVQDEWGCMSSAKRTSIDSDVYSFLSSHSSDDSSSLKPIQVCYNCETDETSLWRKDEFGHTVCNACKLFYKLHGKHRPKSMRKKIFRRKRTRRLSKSPITPLEKNLEQIQREISIPSNTLKPVDFSDLLGFDELDLSSQLGSAQVSKMDPDSVHFAKISSGFCSPLYKFTVDSLNNDNHETVTVDSLNNDNHETVEALRDASSAANADNIDSVENGESYCVPTRRPSLSCSNSFEGLYSFNVF